MREGPLRDLVVVGPEVGRGERAPLGRPCRETRRELRRVHDEARAQEVVVDLRLDGDERFIGGICGVADDTDVVVGAREPRRIDRDLLEEGVRLRLVDPRSAAPVGDAAQDCDHVGDEPPQVFVIGRVDGDDAVSVELRLGENAFGVEHIRQLDGLLVGSPEVRKDASRLVAEGAPDVGVGGECVERDFIAFEWVEQVAGSGERLPRPLRRGNHLGRTNSAVAVRIDQIEGTCIELEPPRRAGEGEP